MRGARDLQFIIGKPEQDILNPIGVNVIRSFPNRGIRVWGARTTSTDPLWKYVNVRRLFLFLEESIDEGTQWVVFEPNNEQLWDRVCRTRGLALVCGYPHASFRPDGTASARQICEAHSQIVEPA